MKSEGKVISKYMQEEWKEKRLRRMDKALTEIDEAVENAKASMPAAMPNDIGALAYWYGYTRGMIYMIGELVNKGMTVPMEEYDDKT